MTSTKSAKVWLAAACALSLAAAPAFAATSGTSGDTTTTPGMSSGTAAGTNGAGTLQQQNGMKGDTNSAMNSSNGSGLNNGSSGSSMTTGTAGANSMTGGGGMGSSNGTGGASGAGASGGGK